MLRVQISHYILTGLTLKLTTQGHPISKKKLLSESHIYQTESARSAQNGTTDADLRKVRPLGGFENLNRYDLGVFYPKNPQNWGSE